MNSEKKIIVAPVLSSLSFSDLQKLNGTTMSKQDLESWLKEASDKNKGLAVLSVENFVDKMNYTNSHDYFFACVTIEE